MRKYVLAGVVAVMVFAFAAFAATFQLNDSVLAVGDGDVSSCTDEVDVKSWGLETDTGKVHFVRLVIDDGVAGEGCYTGDFVLFAAVYDDEGERIQRSSEHRLGATGPNEGDHEMVAFRSPFPDTAGIEMLRVFIHTKRE
jgi:hypothetical protein